MAMRIQFFGAAGEVTEFCHLVTVGARRLLLDCGMIQGSRRDETRNRELFPCDPRRIGAVILSHAHADQSDLMSGYTAFKNRSPVTLVHGEEHVLTGLSDCLRRALSAPVAITRPGELLALA